MKLLICSLSIIILSSCQNNQQAQFGFLNISCPNWNYVSDDISDYDAECLTKQTTGNAYISIDGKNSVKLEIDLNSNLNSVPLNVPLTDVNLWIRKGISSGAYFSRLPDYNQNAVVTITNKGNQIGEFVEGTITGLVDFDDQNFGLYNSNVVTENLPITSSFRCYIKQL
jgi:hypothetical protein